MKGSHVTETPGGQVCPGGGQLRRWERGQETQIPIPVPLIDETLGIWVNQPMVLGPVFFQKTTIVISFFHIFSNILYITLIMTVLHLSFFI